MGNDNSNSNGEDVEIGDMGVDPEEDADGGIDLSGMASAVEEDSGSSSSGGSSSTKRSGARGNVIIEGQYGSIVLPPDTECERCGRKAEGALVMETSSEHSDATLVNEKPLCRNHREEFEGANPETWDAYDYKTF